MPVCDQIPAMDSKLERLDIQIGKHIAAKGKLLELYRRIGKMLDYRDRRIRELGAERSKISTFELGL